MVGFLTESSQQAGWKPAIISRGYRNRSHAKIQRVRYCENSNLDVDAFGISFVQNAEIIKDIKLRFPNKIIISKIEIVLLIEISNVSKFLLLIPINAF